MKRFSKILVAVLALCLLVGALALAISANTGVEGKFVVQGTGYATWEDAVEAANNTHTIYLNENWTLDDADPDKKDGLEPSGATTNLKINLNGYTVSVVDGSQWLNVKNGANVTIEGEGTLINNGSSMIGASGGAVVTVSATGNGIVINNLATAGNINTFRFHDNSTLNVSGNIVVNTAAKTSTRCVFNVAAGSGTTGAKLNINDAKVVFAKPTSETAASGLLMDITDAVVNINNSDLTTYYGYVFTTSGTSIVPKDKDGNNLVVADDKLGFKWSDEAYAKQSISFAETNRTVLNVTDSTIASRLDGYAAAFPQSYSFGSVGGNIKATFKNSDLYGTHRWFSGNGDLPSGTISTGLLYFEDCNIVSTGEASGQTSNTLATYGVNFKIIGGSVYDVALGAGQMRYIALVDSEGKETGEWVGAYVDNVLLSTHRNANAVPGNWAYHFDVPSNASQVSKSVKLVIGNQLKTFNAGYYSDMSKYNAYLLEGQFSDSLWATTGYTHTYSDGNILGADYYYNPQDKTNNHGTNNLYGFGIGMDQGIWESVTEGANGYLKQSLDLTDKDASVSQGGSKYVNFYTASSSGSLKNGDWNAAGRYSLLEYPQVVFEFDVRSDVGYFPQVSFGSQTRVAIPVYNADGSLNKATTGYQGAPGGTMQIKGTTISGVDVSATIGEWHRVTIVYDVKTEYVESISGSATGNSGASTIPEGVTIPGYSFLGSKVYYFVDGILADTQDLVTEKTFFGGALPVEFADSFYVLEQRVTTAFYANKNTSWSWDNIRVSHYKGDVDLDLYNTDAETGAKTVKTDIHGLDYFLVMPENNALPVAKVDGVNYYSESQAIAALKGDSTLELLCDFASVINADKEFQVVTNGFKFAGVISETHKVVDYSAAGYYNIVEASEDEIFTVKYTFNGLTKTAKIAMGTVVPEMLDLEGYLDILDGDVAKHIVGWEALPELTAYMHSSRVINAVPKTVDVDPNLFVDGYYYANIGDAVAGANGETIVLCKDITVDALEGVAASTYVATNATSKTDVPVGVNVASGANVTIDFNGKTVTQNFEGVLFNVTNGTLTLTGAATFNNVGTFARAAGENAKVVANATGDGFDINSSGKTYNVFVAEGGANLEASGVIDIYAAVSSIIFKLSGSDTTKITDATIISYGPTAAQGRLPSKFFAVGDGNTVNIESSKLEVKCGDMFIANGADYAFSLKDKLAKDANDGLLLQVDSQYIENGKIKDVYFPEFTINITANNSQFIASPGEPNSSQQSGTGGLFRLGDTATKVVLTDCKLEGDSRPIHGDDDSIDGRPWASSEVSPNQFIFINVDYKRATFAVDSNTGKVPTENSPNTLQSNTNVLWIGGILKDFSIGPQFVPMFAQNGVIGVHFVNIASGSSLGYTTATKEEKGGDRTVRPGSVWSTEYYNAYSGAAFVDCMFYATEAEAIAAIKPGSEVLLTKDFKTNAALTGDCKILTNGYFKAPGIVSATHKAAVGANGDVTVSAALPEEIFTINYAFGGKTATQNAALGTVVATPEGISDRFVDSDSKKLVVLKGWTLVDGEDVVVVTGNANAIAKYDSADPVIVYWTTADGKTVLDTDYYLPGEHTTLPEFDGKDIDVDTEPDYYSIARIGWDGIEKVNLAASGEYPITAVMGKVAPDTFPGLKYNITLYANYLLNFWLPKNINGVKSYVVSTEVDGSTTLTKVTNASGGTIENVEYDAFGYILGAAGTDLRSFYIVYTLDDEAETKLTFEIKDMGIPRYAMQLLTQYQEENKTDAKSEAAKSLVVNMANYADQVLNVTGGDKTTPGAKAYTYILENYGAQYLNRYNELTNDKFLEGGAIYTADGVADLNWITKTDASEGNMTALSYISAITFNFNTIEPKFIIELTKNVDTLGLQKPSDGAGGTGAHAMGLHAFAGYVGANPTYCNMWAISKEDGKKWTNDGNMWMEKDGTNGTNSTLYTYYMSANHSGQERTHGQHYQGAYSLKNMTNNLMISFVYDGDSTQATTLDYPVGTVYYSLAAYINSMIVKDAEGNANFIAAAKALYAFSEAAETYSNK